MTEINVSLLYNVTHPIWSQGNVELTVLLAHLIWWYAIVMSIVGLLLHTIGAAYLIHVARQNKTFPFLISIISTDSVYLATVLISLSSARLFPSFSGSVLCKTMTFITNTTTLFSNWCWVSLCAERYLAIYRPLFNYGRRYLKPTIVLPYLLTACVLLESWTLIFATEVDGRACDLDETLASYQVLKYVFLFDSFLMFFAPFCIMISADLSVFVKTYVGRRKSTVLEEIESNELTTNVHDRDSIVVVSKKYRQNARACKHRMIKRFVVLATLDLLLNFPHAVLNLIEAFNRDESREPYVFRYPLNVMAIGVSYSLFYLQYVFNPIYVYLLVNHHSNSKRSTASFQSNRPRTTSLSKA